MLSGLVRWCSGGGVIVLDPLSAAQSSMSPFVSMCARGDAGTVADL